MWGSYIAKCHVSNNVTKSEAESSILECVNCDEIEVNSELMFC